MMPLNYWLQLHKCHQHMSPLRWWCFITYEASATKQYKIFVSDSCLLVDPLVLTIVG